MSEIATAFRCKIARTVSFQKWRGTKTAKFEREDGFFCVDVWFEDGQARMQIRSAIDGLEEAAVVGVALQMAMEWASEETANLKHLPVTKVCGNDHEGGEQ